MSAPAYPELMNRRYMKAMRYYGANRHFGQAKGLFAKAAYYADHQTRRLLARDKARGLS